RSRSMMATRLPACSRAGAMWMARVDVPAPPVSLPTTMTCGCVIGLNIPEVLSPTHSGLIDVQPHSGSGAVRSRKLACRDCGSGLGGSGAARAPRVVDARGGADGGRARGGRRDLQPDQIASVHPHGLIDGLD